MFIKRALVSLVALALMLTGCRGNGPTPVSTEPNPTIVVVVESTTSLALGAGLERIVRGMNGDVAKIGEVVKAATIAKSTVHTAIIPLLQGTSTTSQVTRLAANQALGMLDESVPEYMKTIIQTGINVVLSYVQLPDDPAVALTPAAKAYILAFFGGVDSGLDSFLSGQANPDAAREIRAPVKTLEWTAK